MVYLRDLAKSYLHFAKIWFLDVNFLACKLNFKNNRHRMFRFNFNRICTETIYKSRGFTEVFFNYFVQIILNFNIIIFTYLHINIIRKSEYSCIHITKCKQHQTILKKNIYIFSVEKDSFTLYKTDSLAASYKFCLKKTYDITLVLIIINWTVSNVCKHNKYSW